MVMGGFDMVPELAANEDDDRKWMMFLARVMLGFEHSCGVELKSNWMELNFGNRPSLPFEGHKFRRFWSSVTVPEDADDEYIFEVTAIAKECFGYRVRAWNDLYSSTYQGYYTWAEVGLSVSLYEVPDERTIEAVTGIPRGALSQSRSTLIEQSDEPESSSAAADRQESPSYTPISNEPNPLNPMNPHLYEVKDIQGKGKGLVAKIQIQGTTRIIAEAPLFTFTDLFSDHTTMTNEVTGKLKELSKSKQREFFSLSNPFPGRAAILGTVWTNAFPITAEPPVAAIFPVIARINHSCTPNTCATWNSTINCATVHALRPIQPGEELTLAYDHGEASDRRKESLRDHYAFTCTCAVCSLPQAGLQESDARRWKIKWLRQSYRDEERSLEEPGRCLAMLRVQAQLIEEEYAPAVPYHTVGNVYEAAAALCLMHGDLARGQAFAEWAWRGYVVTLGFDNPETMKVRQAAKDPSQFTGFGQTTKWATRLEDKPTGLSKEDWERWIWQNAT